MYRLLFMCFLVCTVTDFSAEDKAVGVKFCMAVHLRLKQGTYHFGEICSLRSSPEAHNWMAAIARACTRATHRIGMCGLWICSHHRRWTYLLLCISGWKRERVIRGVQDAGSMTQRCDIYYYTPENSKLVCYSFNVDPSCVVLSLYRAC